MRGGQENLSRGVALLTQEGSGIFEGGLYIFISERHFGESTYVLVHAQFSHTFLVVNKEKDILKLH